MRIPLSLVATYGAGLRIIHYVGLHVWHLYYSSAVLEGNHNIHLSAFLWHEAGKRNGRKLS